MQEGRSKEGLTKFVIALRQTTALTAPPLLILAVAMILSGYAIIRPQTTEALYGISYTQGILLHSTPIIRYGFTALALIHGWAGALILTLPKLIKAGHIKTAYATITLISALVTYVITPLLIVEIG